MNWLRSLREAWLEASLEKRKTLSLLTSLGISVLFVAINLLAWAMQGSRWYAVLAGYYGLLAVMRLMLARGLHAPEKAQWQRVRRCAILLLLVNFSLTAVVLMVLFVGRGFAYHGVMIYAVAAYAFYSVIHAAVALLKRRGYVHPLETAAQAVVLCAAMVSMLALEIAMLTQFGQDMAEGTRRLFIMLTGAGVSAGIIGVAVWMMRRASCALKKAA